MLDTSATYHMTFKRDFFEELSDNIDGVVYFVDKSVLKPKGIETIRLKLPRFPNIMFRIVLYIPEF